MQLIGTRRNTRPFEVSAQSVRVCFVELEPGHYLELIEPTTADSPLHRYTRTGFYHLCFLVGDLQEQMSSLERGYRAMPAFASEAFDGHQCQFVVTPESHLIEFAEMTSAAFAAHFNASLAPPA
jgi:hypothetical protein